MRTTLQRLGAERVAILAIALLVFALYAPAVRLMPFHDDAVLMPAINNRSLLTIFENRPFGDGHHRPISYLPWLLTRDLFGWFEAPILHGWNVWAHVLNTALVGMLAARAAMMARRRAHWAAAMAALVFGLSPFAYEPVLWASALVHPLSALLGLSSVHAYLTARGRRGAAAAAWIATSVGLLLAACLSHEAGFLFAGLIAILELIGRLYGSSRINFWRLAPCALGLAYPLYYRFVLVTKWTSGAGGSQFAGSLGDVAGNVAAQTQGLSAPVLVWLSPAFARLSGDALASGLTAFTLVLVAVTLALLWRTDYLPLAVTGLAWWALAIVPSSLLEGGYVVAGERAYYVPSIGSALFWGAALGALITARSRALRYAVLAGLALTCARFAQHVSAREAEAARLTPALAMIDADLRASLPDDKLLLINSSFANFASQPTFPLGREGLPIWEYGFRADQDGPFWAWPASVSGIVRDTRNVLHQASIANRETEFGDADRQFTTGGPFNYGLFGKPVDDGAIRRDILASNLVYRFEYDPPGFRAVRLARIEPSKAVADAPVASFSDGAGGITLERAAAARCGDALSLDLTWAGADAITQPASVFVHAMGADGRRIIVADRDPVGGYVPLEAMPRATRVRETREIRGDGAQAVTELRLGVYRRADGRRYTALRPDGAGWPEDQVAVPVTGEACSWP